jgi:cytoskeletal protein CcmA (bactofilin family)
VAPTYRDGGIGGLWRFLGFSPSTEEEAPPRAVVAPAAAAPVDPGRAVLGSGLALRGEISGEGDFQIFGRFEGEIDVSGRVTVSEAAQVDANINAASILIAGKVRGNLSATTRLDILPTGVLTGTLKAGSFSAAEGSSVKGEIWLERAEPVRASDSGVDDDERVR